jgi:hypothetical protein
MAEKWSPRVHFSVVRGNDRLKPTDLGPAGLGVAQLLLESWQRIG